MSKLIRISELSKMLNLVDPLTKKPLNHILRYWEREFKEIKPKKTYLTHMSHLLGFHNEVSKKLPKNVFLAYDNLKINSN